LSNPHKVADVTGPQFSAADLQASIDALAAFVEQNASTPASPRRIAGKVLETLTDLDQRAYAIVTYFALRIGTVPIGNIADSHYGYTRVPTFACKEGFGLSDGRRLQDWLAMMRELRATKELTPAEERRRKTWPDLPPASLEPAPDGLLAPLLNAAKDAVKAGWALGRLRFDQEAKRAEQDKVCERLINELEALWDRRLTVGFPAIRNGYQDGQEGWEYDVKAALSQLVEVACAPRGIANRELTQRPSATDEQIGIFLGQFEKVLTDLARLSEWVVRPTGGARQNDVENEGTSGPMTSPSLLIPEDIDPFDYAAARRAGIDCVNAVGEFLQVARIASSRAVVTNEAILHCLYRLDSSFLSASDYHVGVADPVARARDLTKRLRKSIRRAIQSFRQSKEAPSEGWISLWEVYRQMFGDSPRLGWADAESRIEKVDCDKEGLLNTASIFIPLEVIEHPWHPSAWSYVCQSVKEFDEKEVQRLCAELIPSAKAGAALDDSLVEADSRKAFMPSKSRRGPTMAESLVYDVFLSHSSKDKAIVRDVAERLRADGLRVWFDEWEIKPGDSIPAKVEEGLERSRVLVLCMSANAFGSDWATLEGQTFRYRDPLNKERRFIPLRLDDAQIKGSLAQFLYIKWLQEDGEQEYAKLREACRPLAQPPVVELGLRPGTGS
jgi:hypothetical protein